MLPRVSAPIWLAILAGVIGLAGLAAARPPALTAPDQEQPRLDLAAPVPQGEQRLEQTFTPTHNGLSGIELLAVVYPPAAGSPPPALTLTLSSPTGSVAEQQFTAVTHNAPLRLSFSPQPASARQVYTLTLRGPEASAATAWAYSLDGYAAGHLRFAGQPQPGDLRFSTTYTYLWADVLRDLLRALRPLARLALPLWLLLFAPGLLLLDLLRLPRLALPVRLGLSAALSLACLTLGWLWAGALGWRWSPLALAAIYGLAGVVVAARWLVAARHAWRARRWRVDPHLALLVLILVLGSAPRLVAIRDLVLPQWVDGPHHFAIARVLAAAGHVPPSYAPLLPIEHFSYHFGFHALAVSAHWLAGLPLEDVFMWLGQVLQALVPLSAYAAVAALTRRPRAGLLAATFLVLISYFPGYYLTWGRYTQLAGALLFFPALAAVTSSPGDGFGGGQPMGARASRARPALAGLLAAGLLLTHYPLFVLWLVWVAVNAAPGVARGLAPLLPFGRASPHDPARAPLAGAGWLAHLLLAGAAGAVLAAPWLWRLGSRVGRRIIQNPGLLTAPAGYNAFPTEYFSLALERGWLIAALVGLGLGVLARDRLIWRVALWGALAWLLVNAGQGNWLVNNNTLAITLFVPGAILLGWGADRWLALAERWTRPAPVPPQPPTPLLQRLRPALGAGMLLLFGAGLGYGAGRGLPAQAGLVNPVTVLASPSDAEALAWIDAHTPSGAVFAINAWEWLNGTWAGSDGGAWIWPLTGRRTTLPPADYAYGSLAQQAAINDYNRRLFQAGDLDPPALRALFQEGGVTHIFMGARGGPLRPEAFLAGEHYRLLFTNGAAWVFAVLP